MRRAETLEQAFQNLEPSRALTVEQLQDFYVERPEVQNLLNEMRLQLELQYPCKGLLTGHRGAGKSSALTKLGHTLSTRKRRWVVHISILDKLDLNDLSYIDIVFLMAVEIVQSCVDAHIDLDGHDQSLQNWVRQIEVIRQEERSSSVTAAAEIRAGMPKLGWLTLPVQAFLSVGAKVGEEANTRKIVREQLEPQFSELLGIIDDLQQAIYKARERRLVCLIDGLDKASIETAEKLFYKNGFYLSAPGCSVIYTFPVSLQHNENFNQTKAYFTETFVLPNFKVQYSKFVHKVESAGTEESKGIAQLCEVITRRAEHTLFNEKTLKTIALFSGGIARTAIALSQSSVRKALARESESVAIEHVEAAIAEERRSFDRQLSEKQKKLLTKVQQTEHIDADPEAGYLDLLHNLSVIEYANGDVWYGVSPIVSALLD